MICPVRVGILYPPRSEWHKNYAKKKKAHIVVTEKENRDDFLTSLSLSGPFT